MKFNIRTFFSRKGKKQGGLVMLAHGMIDNDQRIDNAINALKREIALHGIPDSEEERIKKVREDARREIERQKRISPTKERMARLQLEERIFPKRIDPSQVKRHNREIAQSITMSEAGTLYAVMVDGNGIRELSDMEKVDPKIRRHILKIILDAQTMEKLIKVCWEIEPQVSAKSGIEQRQAISNAIKNLFF